MQVWMTADLSLKIGNPYLIQRMGHSFAGVEGDYLSCNCLMSYKVKILAFFSPGKINLHYNQVDRAQSLAFACTGV